MAKFIVSPGRKLTTDSDTDKEHTYVEGDLVEMTKAKAEQFIEDGTLYPEGEEAPKPPVDPKKLDPETGLLPSGEATADTPPDKVAPPVQVGPLLDTYVPGEPSYDAGTKEAEPREHPTVDDLTPEEIAALTPEHLREPEEEPEAVDDETGEVIEDVVEVEEDTPVEDVQEDTDKPEDT